MCQDDFNTEIRAYVADQLAKGVPDVVFVQAWAHVRKRRKARGARWKPALKSFCERPMKVPQKSGYVRVFRQHEQLDCPNGVRTLTGYYGMRLAVR